MRIEVTRASRGLSAIVELLVTLSTAELIVIQTNLVFQ